MSKVYPHVKTDHDTLLLLLSTTLLNQSNAHNIYQQQQQQQLSVCYKLQRTILTNTIN